MSASDLAPKLFKSSGGPTFHAARKLIQSSVWWVSHPSGPCKAPKYAEHVSEAENYPLMFGQNTFFVGSAINEFLSALSDYVEIGNERMHKPLINWFASAVQGAHGNWMEDYPVTKIGSRRFLVFGSLGICLEDVREFFEKWIVDERAKSHILLKKFPSPVSFEQLSDFYKNELDLIQRNLIE